MAEVENVVGELIAMALVLSVPSVTLPYAARALPVLMVKGASAVMADVKVLAAATVRLLELLVPIITLPKALREFPAETVTAAFAVTGAVDAKVVAALMFTA